ncbi:amidohydrolase family protein [Nonomuraea candida]|uniref:amidohydrolase family protein n=1 Tax=Nonomuraea candida TaxID=359159 RepID=UPI0005BD8D17|nr:amidohydrolase family protein [Nonomuraea candida]
MTGLIDVHAHFVTDSYVGRARAAGHDLPDGVPAWPSWSAGRHLELMGRSGIDRAVLSVSSPGVHFGDDAAARLLAREVNEDGAAIVRDHPSRFGLFASLPLPDVAGSLEEIAYAFDVLHADGVVMESNAHGVYLGDPRLEPVFAELGRRGAVVFLHPTSPVCWRESALGRPRPMIEFIFDTARSVTDLLFAGTLDRHPGLKVIVPHCGGALPVLADRINGFMRLFSPGAGPAPDAVALLRRFYYDTAGPAFPRQIPALLSLADPARLLYGSDYCWTPAEAAAEHARAFAAAPAPVEGETWPSLTTANARALLGGCPR